MVLALLLALLGHEPARAGWPPGGVLLGPGYSTFGVHEVRMFPDSAGGVALAFRWRGGTGYVIHYERILASGDVLYDVPMIGGLVGATPGAAEDSEGGAYFAYSTGGDVYLYRWFADGEYDPAYSGNGYPVAATPSPTFEFEPRAATDGGGGCYVSWVTSSPSLSLKLSRVLPEAVPAPGWPATGLPIGPTSPYWSSHLEADGAGGVFVSWVGGSGPFDAMLQRITSSAMPSPGWPAGGLPLFSSSGAPGILPMFASGKDHLFAAGFDSTDRVIWLQRMHRDGSVPAGWESGPFTVQAASPIANVEAIPDGEDGAYVAWRTPSEIRALRVLPDGTPAPGWAATGMSILDAAAVPADEFHVAHGASGGLVVAWEDHRHPSRRFARVRWLLGDGTADPTQPDSGRVVAPEALLADVKGAMPDGSGGVFVAWNEDLYNVQGVTPAYLSWLPYPIPLDVAPAPALAGLRMSAPRPNPATREVAFTVTTPDGDPARAEMVDLSGRRVRSLDLRGAGEHQVRFGDVGALPAGVYFVRVSQGGSSVSDRVAIVH